MFEIEDAKLGRVRVVNVTEARSHIAAIMNDRDYNYIITKNNKPIRVIVNYSTVHMPKTGSQSRSSRVNESVNSLQGLLENREKDIKRQSSRGISELIEPTKIIEEVPLEEEIPIPKGQLRVEKQELSESVESADAASLSVPDFGDEPSYWSPTEEQALDLSYDETQQKEPSVSEQEENIDFEGMDQSQKDYYSRYKKLYQPLSTKFEASHPLTSPQARQESSTSTISNQIIIDDLPESLREVEAEEFQVQKAAVETQRAQEPPAHKVQSPNYSPVQASQKSRSTKEPPSIHDILKELENEKLSGEEDDEALSEDDINRLLNRISK